MLLARQDDSPPEHHHPHAPLMRCSAVGSSVFPGRLRRRPCPPSAPTTPDLRWGASAPCLCEGSQGRRSSEILQSQRVGEAAAGIEGKVVADAGSAMVWPNGAQRRHRFGACWNRISADRQRERKAQPPVCVSALGVSPFNTMCRRRARGLGTGTADSRASVYRCARSRRRPSCPSPSSARRA
jgi:hypothetical protein